ncbi:MAG TPA: type VI secretion system tube protein Hcp [Acetobacteraceae bacterium]|nr:type VI secretion system tube protein Hcp [Acetobacteraceae bacterium]
MAIYMEYGSIKGNVTATGFKDKIELNSFQFGVGRGVSAPRGSVDNREASAPSISEIVVTKMMDSSSIGLFQDAVAGVFNTKVTLYFTTTTDKKTETYLQYELEKCGLSGYSLSSGGDKPSESLSLNFAKITYKWATIGSDGKPSWATVIYDLGQLETG